MDVRKYLYDNLKWEIKKADENKFEAAYKISTYILGEPFAEYMSLDKWYASYNNADLKEELIEQCKHSIIQKIFFFLAELFKEPVHFAFLDQDGTGRIISNHIATLDDDEFHLIMEYRIEKELKLKEFGFYHDQRRT